MISRAQCEPARQDQPTIESVLLAVRPRLNHVLAHFSIPAQDAEDLVQDAVLSLILKFPQVRAPESWLAGAVRKECLQYWRRRMRCPEQAMAEDPASPANPSPDEERVILRVDLGRALRSLPVRSRRFLLLRHRQGREMREIAQALGYSPASMDTVSQRCMAALRACLQRTGLRELRRDRQAGAGVPPRSNGYFDRARGH